MAASGKYGNAWDKFRVKYGDLWEAGPHRFLCADVSKEGSLVRELAGRIDFIYTDPPWNQGVLGKFYTYAFPEADVPRIEDVIERFGNLARDVCPEGIICADFGERLEYLLAALGPPMAWFSSTYGAARTPMKTWFGSLGSQPVDLVFPPRIMHGWELCEWVMDRWLKPGMRFLDPFCGAGNFPLRAAKRGAKVVGVELIPRKLAQSLLVFEKAGFPVHRA